MDAKSKSVAVIPVIAFVFAVVSLGGCGGASSGEANSSGSGDDTTSASGSEGAITVFAAASLTDAFGELGEDFAEQSGAKVMFNFAGSSTLATQIEQGAPADVFASADETQMENVAGGGLVSGEPEVFVRNREVIVVPADNPGNIEDFSDLANPDLRLVLAQEDVPAAEYAEEIIGNASEEPQYGEQFERDVTGNLVSREEDVRAAVNRVVLGDADATFGYASDVTPEIRDEVEVIEIPEDLQVVAEYPVAVLSSSENAELAGRWVDFVTGEEGQRALEKWGFEPVS